MDLNSNLWIWTRNLWISTRNSWIWTRNSCFTFPPLIFVIFYFVFLFFCIHISFDFCYCYYIIEIQWYISMLLHKCFPVSFTKYFRTLFFFEWLLLLNTFFCLLCRPQSQKACPSTFVVLNIFERNTVNCLQAALCSFPDRQ